MNEIFRVLIIEDNPDRAGILISWLPQDAKYVLATSAGKVMGLLKRDQGRVYAAVLLDHDLQEQLVVSDEQFLSGSDLIEPIRRWLSKGVPILIHSVNQQQGPIMSKKLENAGFHVTRIPMSTLTREQFNDWIEYARDLWEDNLAG